MASKHYQDEIPPSTGRIYSIEDAGDSKSRIKDETVYEQIGTPFGAEDVNAVCILELGYEKVGSVHQLTTENSAPENIKFFAKKKYDAYDTFTLNGSAVYAKTVDGNILGDGFFAANTMVYCSYREGILYFNARNIIPDGIIPISKGGTGASDAASALLALGALPMPEVITGSTEDLDSYTTPGFYCINNSSNVILNAPNNAVNGWLLVLRYTSTVYKQFWSRVGSISTTFRDTYCREHFSSGWSNWAKYMTDTDVPTLAAQASKLETQRQIRTNLASTSTASFDGSANVTPGVTGILPLANGGTGAATASAARTALGAAATSHTHAASAITSGTLPIGRGGTGASTAAAALKAIMPETAITASTFFSSTKNNTTVTGTIKKVGNRIIGYAEFGAFTSSAGGQTTMATIASGYRPSINANVSGRFVITSGNSTQYYPAYGYIHYGGNVFLTTDFTSQTNFTSGIITFDYYVG